MVEEEDGGEGVRAYVVSTTGPESITTVHIPNNHYRYVISNYLTQIGFYTHSTVNKEIGRGRFYIMDNMFCSKV